MIVVGFAPAAETPAARLQRTFGIDTATAEALLSRLPAAVQRSVSRVRAEYFRRALGAIGAQVEVRNAAGELVAAEVEAVAAPAAAAVTPAFHWSDPEPVATRQARPEVDPMSATMAQHGAAAAQASRLDRMGRNSTLPATAVPAFAPAAMPAPPSLPMAQPVRSNRNATLREAVYAPVAAAPAAVPVPAPTWGAIPTVMTGAAPAAASTKPATQADPRGQSAAEAGLRWGSLHTVQQSAPAPAPAPAPTWAAGVSASRDPSSVFDPPPAARPQRDGRPVSLPAPEGALAIERNAAPVLAGPAPMPAPPAAPAAPWPVAGPMPVGPSPFGARAPFGAGAAFGAGPIDVNLGPTPFDPRDDDVVDPPPVQLPGITLDADDEQPRRVLNAWESPRAESMAEPAARPSRRPAGPRERIDRRMRRPAVSGPPPAQSSPPRPEPAIARAGVPDRKRHDASLSNYDPRSFWDTFGSGLALPFSGPGPYWIAAIAAWAVAVAVLGALSNFVFGLGAVVMFFANTSLLAIACDYYRVCVWPSVLGEELDVAPSFDPALILNRYIKSGMHLSAFMIASQVPVIAWFTMSLLDGEELVGLLLNPVTWVLFAFPYLYWPMGVGLCALNNDYSGIWNVVTGIRAIARAPLEYMAIVFVGMAALAVSWIALMMFGSVLGITGAVMGGTAGIPLAISHGLQGGLFGHLARARGEIFE